MKRASWLDTIAPDPALTPALREFLRALDDRLFELWNLGENILLGWTREAESLRFLAVRHYRMMDLAGPFPAVLEGSKFLLPADFQRLERAFGATASAIRVPVPAGAEPDLGQVNGLVTRYGVSLVRERAVMLLDIVGFSLHPPLEQVAMLNSLSYSVNTAYRQLVSEDVQINFARSSTGDGFYIWNRAKTVDANIALFRLLMLILADNAVAQSKASAFPVPRLRAAFHVGEHYEFYQVEALNPTTFSYIVGPVTIELARILDKARAGQVLLGEFGILMRDAKAGGAAHYDTRRFVARTAEMLQSLRGLSVYHDRIADIRCYLTGEAAGEGGFRVERYLVADKHGMTHAAYNAKINIHLEQASPIYLGCQHGELHPPGAAPWMPTG